MSLKVFRDKSSVPTRKTWLYHQAIRELLNGAEAVSVEETPETRARVISGLYSAARKAGVAITTYRAGDGSRVVRLRKGGKDGSHSERAKHTGS